MRAGIVSCFAHTVKYRYLNSYLWTEAQVSVSSEFIGNAASFLQYAVQFLGESISDKDTRYRTITLYLIDRGDNSKSD